MVTDRFIQICPSRTGSSSIKILLYELADAGRIVMIDRVPHTSYEANVQHYRKAGYVGALPPVVASVRNPWDWYVSKWWYGLERRPERDFAPTFRGHMENVQRWLAGDPAKDWNFGTFTNAWNHVGGDNADLIRRYENFIDEAVSVWYAIMPDIVDPKVWRSRLEVIGQHEGGKGNLGKLHEPYWTYYDDELRGWVAEWDAEMIDRFGYAFGGECR